MRSGQNPNRARILRRNQTDVERRLWRLLRDRRLEGFKFRRQQSIGLTSPTSPASTSGWW
jgi:2-isopropylmalate synthase